MKGKIKIGWSQANITPDEKVFIAGQFHARVSEGIMDPITATVLAIESDNKNSNNYAIMISCDLVTVSEELRDAVRTLVKSRIPTLDPNYIFMSATHTHTAPTSSAISYGLEEFSDIFDVMHPTKYVEFASERIANAVVEAWEKREISGIAYGMDHAVVGRNRRLSYKDGTSKMYGKSNTEEFSHVEGYEDHSLFAMMTYNANKTLTGIIVNVNCPSQVSETLFMISADFWHETRQELRKRFGENVYILSQCAPGGDQSPHLLIGKRAEERMWRLKGRALEQNPPRAEIAEKIANAVDNIIPYAEKEIDWEPEFFHKQETINLPRRLISEEDVKAALEESDKKKEEYQRLLAEIKNNPEIQKQPRWYTKISSAYRLTQRGERVKTRFEEQKDSTDMPIQVHAIRIGETAFATNPFELYLDYGIRIQELSKAVQTFLIQKAGCKGVYLPSKRSIAGGGYGSVPASTDIGPEGGDKLVEWTVSTINDMFK
ncbi:hypothetical protein M0P98_06885 [bacterium]|nr:hypothetical protein [bacterium]